MSDHIQQQPSHGSSEHVSTHAAGHGHDHAHASPFTPAQWQEFQKSDIGAGGAVVVLMAAIFTIGLLLYTGIAIWVTVD